MRILYIDIDSQRPDHLGCYGYHRATSPAIDAVAGEGVRFDRCYTPDAPCLPSRTALYSGRFGIQTGVVGHGGTAAEPKREGPGRDFRDRFDRDGLARRLQQAGFHTAMISPFGQRHAAWHFYAGFNEIHNTGFNGMESAEQVMPTVDNWLADHATKDRWFLHVNFWDPHTPHRAPASTGEPFASSPIPAWLDDDALIERHKAMTGPHTLQDISMYGDGVSSKFPRQVGRVDSRADMRKLIDGYDTGTHYVDQQIARIVEKLKVAGVYDDTAIIISADHGENYGELGIYAEHGTADEGTCHIPMIIKWPGGRSGVSRSGLIYNLDLAPTLAELIGFEAPSVWDGRSFASSITGDADAGRDQLVLSQCAHVCQRSVRWDRWLYIRTYHDGFHCFPREMLFDLASDPHEQNDLAPTLPEVCREAAWRLMNWHDLQMARMSLLASDSVDPMWTVMREGGPFHARLTRPGNPGGMEGVEKYLKRLEATGRSDGAATIRATHLGPRS
jgi:arylsulfatase A-like enzyme